jgi:hypothetical protein
MLQTYMRVCCLWDRTFCTFIGTFMAYIFMIFNNSISSSDYIGSNASMVRE